MPIKRYLLCVHCNPSKGFEDVAALNSHLRVSHLHLAIYTCGHCKNGFQHKTSLIRHIEQQHISSDNSQQEDFEGSVPSRFNVEESSFSSVQETLSFVSDAADTEQAEEMNIDNNEREPAPQFDLKTAAALFLLELRSSGNVTHASVSLIQNFVTKLLQDVLQGVGNKTKEFLDGCGVRPEQSTPFLSGNTFNPGNPFEGLDSVEEQLLYFCEKYGMVVPEEKYLGSRIENRFDRETRTFIPKQVPETFHYVSIIDTLKLIFSNPVMRRYIELEQESTDGVYRSYKDGSDFKANRFLRKFPNAIRLLIYLDDLEIANALGSKDVIHKLGCFYFSIQNLPPEESSQLSSVFLFALAYAEDLKKKGIYDKVLKPLLDEMRLLMSEDGVVLPLSNGETFTLRACVSGLSADSLAAHHILGLMSPSADKFCRLCLISKKDFSADSAAIGRIRTAALHKQHLKAVEKNPACRSEYGVDNKSPLLEIMRVPEDSAFDAFHDLVGVIQMDIKLALYEYICVRKLFSAEDFNGYINMFQYGKPDVRNKPSPTFLYKKLCDKGHSFKQNGSQTFCLLRIFPFVIPGVEVGDPILELIFLLQDIVKIMLSFEAKESDILNLDNLVKEHNNLFHSLFVSPVPAEQVPIAEDENLENSGESDVDSDEELLRLETEEELEIEEEGQNRGRRRRRRTRKVLKKGINKLHHLMHAAQQMREKGPLVRLWCAKYEGRHRIFRKHAGVQSNFQNPPKTMAKMFQLSTLGPILAKTEARKEEPILNTTGVSVTLVESSPYRDMLLREGLNRDDKIDVVQSAERCGEEYSTGLFVTLNGSTSALPEFAVIDSVLVVNKPAEPSQLFLAVLRCQNQGLCPRYNAYKISNEFSSAPELVSVDQLANFRAIAPWNPVSSTNLDTLYLYPRTVYV